MHTDANRLYSILGVDPAASAEAVHAAFRHRAKQLHPDSPSGDTEAFIRLKRAYDMLSDPRRRAEYDRSCRPPPPPEPHRWAVPPSPAARPRTAHKPPHMPRRRSGIGIVRYVIAFLIMAAISLGGVQAMISFTEAPPSIRTRAPVQTLVSPSADPGPAAEAPPLPGSSRSGFWDPNPAPARKN